MSSGRHRKVPKHDLLKFLAPRRLVTVADLRKHFANVSFDDETAFNWLRDAGWEPMRPRDREVWQPKISSDPPEIRNARIELSQTLMRYSAEALVSSIGVVVLMQEGRTSGTVAEQFRDAELPDVHLIVASTGGVLLSVHPGSQSEVVRAIQKVMEDPTCILPRRTVAA